MSYLKTALLAFFAVSCCNGSLSTKSNGFQLNNVIENLATLSSNLTNAVTSYQPYRYDSNKFPMNFIDGGHDLYDNGIMIRFVEGRRRRNLEYNATVTTTRYNVTTLAINPFVALATISNPEEEPHFYTFRVNGDLGTDGKGNIATEKGQVAEGNGIADYYLFQVYNSDYPTLCEVFFTISNKDFDSVAPKVFRVIRFSTSTRVTNSVVRISGRPHNIYFGIIVLSRQKSELIPDHEIRDVMRLLLKATSPTQDAFTEASVPQQITELFPQETTKPGTEQTPRFSTTPQEVFAGQSRRGEDINGADRSGTRFSGSDLRGMNMYGTNCTNCDFSGADSRGGNFYGSIGTFSDFSGSDFSGCQFNGTAFSNSRFVGADFSGSAFYGVDFSKSDYTSADFSGSFFAGSTFRESQFFLADFSGTKYQSCDFGNSNFTSADFSGSEKVNSNFQGVGLEFDD